MEKSSKILLALLVIFILSAAVFVAVVKKCNIDLSSCAIGSMLTGGSSSNNNDNQIQQNANNSIDESLPQEIQAEPVYDQALSGSIKEINGNSLVVVVDTSDFDDTTKSVYNLTLSDDIKVTEDNQTEGSSYVGKQIQKNDLKTGDSILVEFNDKKEVGSIVRVIGSENSGDGWTELED